MRREDHCDRGDVDGGVGDFLNNANEFGTSGSETVGSEDEMLQRRGDFFSDDSASADEFGECAEEVSEGRTRVKQCPGSQNGSPALTDCRRNLLRRSLESSFSGKRRNMSVQLDNLRAPQSTEGSESGDRGRVLHGPARDDDAAKERRELSEEESDRRNDVRREESVEALGKERRILRATNVSWILSWVPKDGPADAETKSSKYLLVRIG